MAQYYFGVKARSDYQVTVWFFSNCIHANYEDLVLNSRDAQQELSQDSSNNLTWPTTLTTTLMHRVHVLVGWKA